jgi:hypothetical protein
MNAARLTFCLRALRSLLGVLLGGLRLFFVLACVALAALLAVLRVERPHDTDYLTYSYGRLGPDAYFRREVSFRCGVGLVAVQTRRSIHRFNDFAQWRRYNSHSIVGWDIGVHRDRGDWILGNSLRVRRGQKYPATPWNERGFWQVSSEHSSGPQERPVYHHTQTLHAVPFWFAFSVLCVPPSVSFLRFCLRRRRALVLRADDGAGAAPRAAIS